MKITILLLFAIAALITVGGVTGLFHPPAGKKAAFTRQTVPARSDSDRMGSCCIPCRDADEISGNSIYQLTSAWTDQEGKHIRLSDFRNRPTVIAMFYSHCTYACPLTINDMKTVETGLPDNLKDRVRFVLVSFDPERDTPGVLRILAEQRGLNKGSWELLTGRSKDIRTLAEMLGVEFKMQADGSFAHTSQITVLNEAGDIIHKHLGLNEPVGDIIQAIESASRNAHPSDGALRDRPE